MDYRIYNSSALERLCLTSGSIELWWDSNPSVYEEWQKSNVNSIPEDIQDIIGLQLTKLWNRENAPGNWVFSGATIDPLVTKALIDISDNQRENIIEFLTRTNAGMNYRQIAWGAYKEICKCGAKLYMPIYAESRCKHGFVSVQTDPRSLNDTVELVKQGLEIKDIQPNIMVQVPATKAGIHAIHLLTSLGIPTNTSLCFTLPQIMAVAEAVAQGKKAGERCAMDYSRWCSVITIMIDRFEDAKIFEEQAYDRGIEINEEMKRWAGIAVTRKACRILKERDFPSKIIVASGNIGSKLNNVQYIRHIERLAGCNLIFTVNPGLIKSFMMLMDKPIKKIEGESIPEEVMEKLLKIPYFAESYGEDTIRQEDFETMEPTVTTNNQLSSAVIDLENYVKSIF